MVAEREPEHRLPPAYAVPARIVAARIVAARVCAVLLLILVLGAEVTVASSTARSEADPVHVWLTTADLDSALTPQPDQFFEPDSGRDARTIAVDDGVTYQQMDGFGAAMTDTSAWLIAAKLHGDARTRLLRALFSSTQGIGIDWVRVPMGSSDYTHDHYYSYDDNGGAADPQLAHFSIGHDLPYIVPLLRQALRINPAIKLNANPWSPPAWMKSNHSMIGGGSLLPEYYEALAEYFVKFLQAYAAQGLGIYAIQPQNEPLAQAAYPTMYWPAVDEARFIGDDLGPALAGAGLHPKILGFDQNWDQPGYAETLLRDNAAAAYLAGTAWHTYYGSSSAMTLVHGLFPDKDTYETESSVANPADLFINAARNWSRSGVMWNIALDTLGGPLPRNVACQGCIGLVTIDQAAGTYTFTRYYYQIGQFSKFVEPGAYRIASSSFGSSLEDVAFRNPDGSEVLVVYNGSHGSLGYDVLRRGATLHSQLPAGATETLVWRGSGA